MKRPEYKREPTPHRRRYVVHLCCAMEADRDCYSYIAQIHPWTGRRTYSGRIEERLFTDDSELIATVNPLLPSGSDVRDVFEHIETPSGFYYLLSLTKDEAAQLGWEH